jgi:hypothetical protein
MNWLQTQLSRRDAKYLRNLNRYCNNGQRRENIYELYNNPVAYYYMASETDTGPWPVENILKSCIDTKISKMSQVKVRPFFNPVNGKWKTRKVCKTGQQFFDEYYQRYNVYSEAIQAYRDAQIFDVGHVWANEETGIPRRVRPWEYYADPAELHYGKLSRVMLRFWKFPLLEIKDKLNRKKESAAFARFERDIHAKADELHIYYDLEGKRKYTFVEEELIEEKSIEFDHSPIATIYCVPPVKGMWSTSIIDDLYTLQRELDIVNQKIHDATVLTPANLIFVPSSLTGGVKKSTIDAGREGLIYEYEPVSGGNTPVEFVTPAPVNQQLLVRRQNIIDTMYQISGVSQLSAQAKKPTGLNSGVALDTLEDVESERHNFELLNYERFCMEIAETKVRISNSGEKILPKRAGRSDVTWKDLQEERDYYSIQFSPASALSNTPKTKMEQVEKLQKMGAIGPEMIASVLGFPDLEKSLGIASANRDDVEAITDRAAERGEFDFYEVVNLQDLYRNAMNELMRLDADEPDNGKIIENLKDFINNLKGKMDTMKEAATPPAPPAPPPAAPPVALGQPNVPIPQVPNALGAGVPQDIPQAIPQVEAAPVMAGGIQ